MEKDLIAVSDILIGAINTFFIADGINIDKEDVAIDIKDMCNIYLAIKRNEIDKLNKRAKEMYKLIKAFADFTER